ncbi:atrial natriuretic peptide receptor 1-like [Paramacrobiotus metropolitanus]|uniref:atrial natriuretic peptide receptor 1-like n=1 Tax=Paramacrobiotus metropolitanus TaxID=2943436 RepID=UPI002446445B|nr:atrial natriuretic peptide receptor 1-like [Paramacrobiotus metropolitanus]
MLLLPVFFLSQVGSMVQGIHLEMISLLPRSIPVGPALPWTEPALRLAAEMVNRTYAPHITMSLKLIYNMSHKICEDADADNPGLLGQYYYSQAEALEQRADVCLAVVGSICGGLNEAANLAREWNILAFSDGLVRRDAFNNQRLPTAVSLGGAVDSFAMVLMNILEQNGWLHVSILTDIGPGPGFFYGLLSNAMMKMSVASSTMYAFEPTNFNGSNLDTVLPMLLHAKSRSRVIFLLTFTYRAQKILEIARSENMTNAEYVYFIVQPLEQDLYGRVSLFTNASDEMTGAYSRVVYVTVHKTGDDVAVLNRQLAARTPPDRRTGKPLYDNDTQPLDNFSVRATYDSIELFAKLMNETQHADPQANRCNGSLLAMRMSNRSFNLQTGESYITTDGTRNLDLDIYGYDLIASVMKPLMWYDSVANTLVRKPIFRKDNGGHFQSPLIYPPRDEPVCGYNGHLGPCAGGIPILVIILPVVGAVVLFGFLSMFIARRLKRAGSRNDKWWLISSDDLHIQIKHPSKQSAKAELKDKTVWIKPVSIPLNFNIDSMLGFPVLQQLRGIHHPNINTFLGICFHPQKATAYLVSEHCPRGSLLELQKHMTLDWDFSFSLMRNLIEGLLYIHHSTVRYHGNLDIHKCLIDGRFSLKIGALRYDAIGNSLNKDPKGNSLKERQAHTTGMKRKSVVESGQRDDIHVFGTIALELLGSVATEVIRKNPKYSKLDVFLKECVGDTGKQKPTMRMVDKAFNEYSRSSAQDVVQLVMRRVEKYTEVLEEAVAEKTKELINEQHKADLLLREMLPPSVVDKLRNKIVIEPEYFEAVTISFSDLPGFVAWVATATPYDVIELLNTIYSIFDEEISSHHMVQKIETIGDCYMVASGVPIRIGNQHAAAVCRLAKSLHKAFNSSKLADKGLMLRVGVHSDHCAASVIGSKVPRYCLFGDAVNTASRMESHGEGGKVHLSYKTRAFLTEGDDLVCERRGLITVKGKGEMETFWLEL